MIQEPVLKTMNKVLDTPQQAVHGENCILECPCWLYALNLHGQWKVNWMDAADAID